MKFNLKFQNKPYDVDLHQNATVGQIANAVKNKAQLNKNYFVQSRVSQTTLKSLNVHGLNAAWANKELKVVAFKELQLLVSCFVALEKDKLQGGSVITPRPGVAITTNSGKNGLKFKKTGTI